MTMAPGGEAGGLVDQSPAYIRGSKYGQLSQKMGIIQEH
jgi:hypothetical protein